MTEGAITLAVASIRAEGSDAGVDKARGVMLPILAVSPGRPPARRSSKSSDDGHRRAGGGGEGEARANTADDSFAADIGEASSSVAGGGGGGPSSPQPIPRGASQQQQQQPSASPAGGLEISAKWTLEPLHGGGGGGGGSHAPTRRRSRHGSIGATINSGTCGRHRVLRASPGAGGLHARRKSILCGVVRKVGRRGRWCPSGKAFVVDVVLVLRSCSGDVGCRWVSGFNELARWAWLDFLQGPSTRSLPGPRKRNTSPVMLQ